MTQNQPYMLTLVGRRYLLVQGLQKGTITFVWKALELAPEDKIPSSVQELDLNSDLVREARKAKANELRKGYPFLQTVELSQELTQTGPRRWVAIKIPRLGQEAAMRSEAKILERLSKITLAPRVRVVNTIADLTDNEKAHPPLPVPVLILEWAPGDDFNAIPAFKEDEGLSLAAQLAKFTQAVLDKGIILTDTLKPGSMKYDTASRGLVLFDLNTVSDIRDDMRGKTIPLLGDIFYQLFTRSLIGVAGHDFNVSGAQIDSDAKEWLKLSLGTRNLVTDLLLKRIPGDNPKEIISTLVRWIEAQQQRGDSKPDQLLASARSADKPFDILNDYDLAVRGDKTKMTQDDEQRYLCALYDMLRGLPPADHDVAWSLLNWARRCFPQDPIIRWNWLARQATQKEPALWEKLMPVLEKAGNLDQALPLLESLASSSRPTLQAMKTEASLWQELVACEAAPTSEKATSVGTRLTELQNLWLANKYNTDYGDAWLDSLQPRVEACRNKAQAISDARKAVQSQGLPTVESLQEWQAVQPHPELPLLIQTRQAIQDSDMVAAQNALDGLGKELKDSLSIRVRDALSVAVSKKVGEARQAIEQSLSGGSIPDIAALEEWQAVQENADLKGLAQAARLLRESKLSECIDALFAPEFPSIVPDDLMNKVWKSLQQAVVKRANEHSRKLVDATQDNWGEARAILEKLDEYDQATPETRAILLLLGKFDAVKQRIADAQSSEALRIAHRETPQELGTLDVSPDKLIQLSSWAKGVFERLLKGELGQASESKRREAEKWLDDPSVGIENALAGAAAALAEAVRLNPADALALQWLESLRAFQRGRYALLNSPISWETAESAFRVVGWNKLVELGRPYAEISRAGATLQRLSRAMSIEGQIQAIELCGQIEIDCTNLDSRPLIMWGDTRLGKWAQRLPNRARWVRRQVYKALSSGLTDWLKSLTTPDAIMRQQEIFSCWHSLLPQSEKDQETGAISEQSDSSVWAAPQVSEETKEGYNRALAEWGARLETAFNYALAQAHLARANRYREEEQPGLAQIERERVQEDLKTARSGYDGTGPDNQPIFARVAEELRKQRQQVWAGVYDNVAQRSSVADALRVVQNYYYLDKFSTQLPETLQLAIPEDAFQTLIAPAENRSEENKKQWAKSMAVVRLQAGVEQLCAWSNVAELVRQKKYKEALDLAELTQAIKPSDQERKPLQDAIAEQGSAYGKSLYDTWKRLKRKQDVWDAIANPSRELQDLDQYTGRDGQSDLKASAQQASEALQHNQPDEFAAAFAAAPVAQWRELSIQVKRQQDRQQLIKVGRAGALVLLLIASVVAIYQFVPPVRGWVSSIPRWFTPMPAATVTVEPVPPGTPPTGRLAVSKPEPRQGGLEIRQLVTITNTGLVSGTFTVVLVDAADVVTQWFNANGNLVSPLIVTLMPGKSISYTLLLQRSSPLKPEKVTMELKVAGQEKPVDVYPLTLPRLQVTFAMSQTEWIQQPNVAAFGQFTPSLGGPFCVACYDATGERRGEPAQEDGIADQAIPFTCSLASGYVGQWYVAVFPKPEQPEGWRPPNTREDSFPNETAFTVEPPQYGIKYFSK